MPPGRGRGREVASRAARREIARTESQRVVHGIVTAIDEDQVPATTVAVGPASHPAYANAGVEYQVGDKVSLSFNGRSYTIIGRIDLMHTGTVMAAAMTLFGMDMGGDATMEVAGIPATHRHLRVVAHANHDQGAAFTSCQVRLNGVSTTSYFGLRHTVLADGTHSNSRIGTSGGPGATSWSFDTGSAAGVLEMTVPNYPEAGPLKSAMVKSFARIGNADASMKNVDVSGYNDSLTAAVTEVSLTLSTGSWLASSHLSVYGLM